MEIVSMNFNANISQLLKTIIMKNLMEMALKATEANVVKRATKENVNDAIFRILYKEGQKLERVQLIAAISLSRVLDENSGEAEVQKWTKEKFEDAMKDVNKTVKNGVDTSISHSNNNSSFHYNEKYDAYTLQEVSGKFEVIKKSKK